MTKAEMLAALSEIGTIEDAAERRSKITQITDEIGGIFDQNDTLSASNTQLEADKEKLQKYNMELYLKVGGQEKKEEPKEPSESLSYEKLFNEKGELK